MLNCGFMEAGSCEVCQGCSKGEQRVGCGGNDFGNCATCPGGKYQPSDNGLDCIDIPGCPAGEYRTGHDTTQTGECRPCEEGKYKDSYGLESCETILFCDPGQYLKGSSVSSAGTCEWCSSLEPCAPGSYRADCAVDRPGSCEQCTDACKQYKFMFNGDCGSGQEIRLQNVNGTQEERAEKCASACASRGSPRNAGWDHDNKINEEIAGFLIHKESEQCWCETASSVNCPRTHNGYIRYDFTTPGVLVRMKVHPEKWKAYWERANTSFHADLTGTPLSFGVANCTGKPPSAFFQLANGNYYMWVDPDTNWAEGPDQLMTRFHALRVQEKPKVGDDHVMIVRNDFTFAHKTSQDHDAMTWLRALSTDSPGRTNLAPDVRTQSRLSANLAGTPLTFRQSSSLTCCSGVESTGNSECDDYTCWAAVAGNPGYTTIDCDSDDTSEQCNPYLLKLMVDGGALDDCSAAVRHEYDGLEFAMTHNLSYTSCTETECIGRNKQFYLREYTHPNLRDLGAMVWYLPPTMACFYDWESSGQYTLDHSGQFTLGDFTVLMKVERRLPSNTGVLYQFDSFDPVFGIRIRASATNSLEVQLTIATSTCFLSWNNNFENINSFTVSYDKNIQKLKVRGFDIAKDAEGMLSTTPFEEETTCTNFRGLYMVTINLDDHNNVYSRFNAYNNFDMSKAKLYGFLWFNSKIEQTTADLILASFDNSTILMTSNTDLIQYPLSVDHFSVDALDALNAKIDVRGLDFEPPYNFVGANIVDATGQENNTQLEVTLQYSEGFANNTTAIVSLMSCTECPAGKYSPSRDAHVCLDCMAGSYGNAVGASACTQCDAGSYQNTPGSTTCILCSPGKFAEAPGQTLCQICPGGTRSNLMNGSVTCVGCEAGKFAPEESYKCEECIPGTFSGSNASACTECAPGKIANASSSTFCRNCSAGQYSNENNTRCEACEPGSFSINATDACTPCAYGTVANKSSATSCYECGVGLYANQSRNACRQCPQNSTSLPPAELISDCICEIGFLDTDWEEWKSDGGTGAYVVENVGTKRTCSTCPAGTYKPSAGTGHCIDCPSGSFSGAAAGVCKSCPSGAVTDPGATKFSDCVCPSGYGQTGNVFVADFGEAKTLPDFLHQFEAADIPSSGSTFFWIFNPAYTAFCPHMSKGTHCSKGYEKVVITAMYREDSTSECGFFPFTFEIYDPMFGPFEAERISWQRVCGGVHSEPNFQSITTSAQMLRMDWGGFVDFAKHFYITIAFFGEYEDWSCLACTPGKYKDTRDNSFCQSCLRGTYNDKNASILAESCLDCPHNNSYTQQPASGSLDMCVCNAGYTGDDGTQCLACRAGTFKSVRGSSQCEMCSPGKFSNITGALQEEGTCTNCPAGTFQASHGASTCNECGADLSSFSGADSNSGCVCDIGLGKSDNGINASTSCQLCPAGKFKNVIGNFSCYDCPVGTYSKAGASACTECPAFSTTSGAGHDNIQDCICKAGFEGGPVHDWKYCAKEGEVCHCTGEIRYGSGGDWVSRSMTGSNSSRCSIDQFPDPYNGSGQTRISHCECKSTCRACQEGSSKREAGNHSCNLCDSGTYSDIFGATACEQCHNNSVTIPGAVAKENCTCVAGFEFSNSQCESCKEGLFKATTGNTACQKCPRGSFNNRTGATVCLSCPDINMHTMERASTNISACMCNAGYTGINGISCTACESGLYKEYPGPSGCLLCLPSTYSPHPAATNVTDCLQCPAHSISLMGSNTLEDCKCVPGYFGGDIDNSSAYPHEGWNNCTKCAMGSFKSINGTSQCQQCSTGHFGIEIGATSSTTCQLCAEGHFSDTTGASMCETCPEATYSDQKGAASCQSCQADVTWILESLDWVFTSCDDVCHRHNKRCDPQYFHETYSAETMNALLQRTFGSGHEAHPAPYIFSTAIGYDFKVMPFEIQRTEYENPSLPVLTWTNNLEHTFRWVFNQENSTLFSESTCRHTPEFHERRLCPCSGFVNGTDVPVGGRRLSTFDKVPPFQEDVRYITFMGWPQNKIARLTSPVGSSRRQDCHCLPGFTGENGTTCAVCSAGQYKESYGNGPCSSCPENTYSNLVASDNRSSCLPCKPNSVSEAESTTEVDCLCKAGFFMTGGEFQGDVHVSGGECLPCPPGLYKPQIGPDQCLLCPSGTYNPDPAAVSVSSCLLCPPGKIANLAGSGQCELCAKGKYQDQPGQTQCLSCPTNSSSESGSDSLSSCKCAPGFSFEQSWSDLGFFKSVCRACSLGKFKQVIGNEPCSLCEEGKYSDRSGMEGCKSCGLHSFSQAGSTTQQACECIPAYEYTPETQVCNLCPMGKFKYWLGRDGCEECPAGTFNPNLGKKYQWSACQACGIGTFSDRTGRAECDRCEQGSFQPKQGQTQCFACPEHATTSPDQLTKYITDCFCSEGYTSAEDPFIDEFSFEDILASDRDEEELQITIDLTPDIFILDAARGSCRACNPGTFIDASTARNGSSCIQCAPGKFSPVSAATFAGVCQSCPATTTCPSGSTSEEACACEPGRETDDENCRQCDAGQFKQGTGNLTRCKPCASNSYSPERGASQCLQCPSPNMTITSPLIGASSDQHCLCKPGFQRTNEGSYLPGDCKQCEGNSVSATANATSCTECIDQTLANAEKTLCVATGSTRKAKVEAKITANQSLCSEIEQDRVCSQLLTGIPNSECLILPVGNGCDQAGTRRRLLQEETTEFNFDVQIWVPVTSETIPNAETFESTGITVQAINLQVTCSPGQEPSGLDNCKYCPEGKTGNGTACDQDQTHKFKSVAVKLDNITDDVHFQIESPRNTSLAWKLDTIHVKRSSERPELISENVYYTYNESTRVLSITSLQKKFTMSDITAIGIQYRYDDESIQYKDVEEMEIRLFEKVNCARHDPSQFYNEPYCKACAAGKFSEDTPQGLQCSNCTDNYYSPKGSERCILCPDTKTAVGGISSSEEDCKCPYWKYLDENDQLCKFCPAGQSTYPRIDLYPYSDDEGTRDLNSTKTQNGTAWLNNKETLGQPPNLVNLVWPFEEPTLESCYTCQPGKVMRGENHPDFEDQDPGNCDYCEPDTFSNASFGGMSCFDCAENSTTDARYGETSNRGCQCKPGYRNVACPLSNNNPEMVWLKLNSSLEDGRQTCTWRGGNYHCQLHECRECKFDPDDKYFYARHGYGDDVCEHTVHDSESYNCSCWNDVLYDIPTDLSNYRENWTMFIAMDAVQEEYVVEYTLFGRKDETSEWEVIKNMQDQSMHQRCSNDTTCQARGNAYFDATDDNRSYVIYNHYRNAAESESDVRNTIEPRESSNFDGNVYDIDGGGWLPFADMQDLAEGDLLRGSERHQNFLIEEYLFVNRHETRYKIVNLEELYDYKNDFDWRKSLQVTMSSGEIIFSEHPQSKSSGNVYVRSKRPIDIQDYLHRNKFTEYTQIRFQFRSLAVDIGQRTRQCRPITLRKGGIYIEKYHYCAREPPYCDACPRGTHSNHTDVNHLNWKSCVSCVPGKYAEDEGMAECKTCPVGKFQPESGQAQCITCPADGEYTLISGSSSINDCYCGPGYHGPLCPKLEDTDKEKQWLATDNETTFQQAGTDSDCYDQDFQRWLQTGTCSNPLIPSDPCAIEVEYKIPEPVFEKDEFFRSHQRVLRVGVAVSEQNRPNQFRMSLCNKPGSCVVIQDKYWKNATIWKDAVDRALDNIDHESTEINKTFESILAIDTVELEGNYSWIKLEARAFEFDKFTFKRKCSDFSLLSTGLYYEFGEWEDCRRHFCTVCTPGKFQNVSNTTECNACPPGSYSNTQAATACTPCETGKYQAESGQVECRSCSAGKYNAGNGSIGEQYCLDCSPGTISTRHGSSECVDCVAGKYNENSGSTVCQLCPKGTYLPAPGSNSSQDCLLCDEGKYGSYPGISSCSDCPENKTSDSNSTHHSHCVCDLGYYEYLPPMNASNGTETLATFDHHSENHSPTPCLACPVGKFKDFTGNGSCISCEPGTYNPYIAKGDKSDCLKCPRGEYSNASASSACYKCGYGEYSDQLGSTNCSACGAGNYFNGEGATSASNCSKCPVGTYGSEERIQECTSCGGTRNSTENSTKESDCFCANGHYTNETFHCIPCPRGTFLNASNSSQCIECAAGKYQDNMAAGDESDCLDCEAGFFSPSPRTEVCTGCIAGKFSSTGSVNCTNCSAGQFSGQNASNCTNCSAGFFSPTPASAQCSECSAGKYSSAGSDRCTNCSAGQYSSQNASHCLNCSAGSYSESEGSARCDLCGLGKYLSFEGSDSSDDCTGCAVDTYADEEGLQFCLACSENKTAPENSTDAANCTCKKGYTNSTNSSCVACDPGTVKNTTGDGACSSCPAGTNSSDDRTLCLQCKSGTYSSEGSESCTLCELGKHSKQGASACFLCSPGKYHGTEKITDQEDCSSCVAGKFGNNSGLSSCYKCPTNKTSPENSTNILNCTCMKGFANSTNNSCVECLPGRFKNETGDGTCSVCTAGKKSAENHSLCEDCAEGYYSDDEADECISCDDGKYSKRGSASCFKCSIGKFHNNNSKIVEHGDCDACPEGTYGNESGLAECFPCPTNKTSSEKSTSILNCTCKKGFANSTNNSCIFCEPGTFKNETGDGTCSVCAAGKRSAENRSECLTCEHGKYSTIQSSTCTACPGGKYTTDGLKCFECPIGTYHGENDKITNKEDCTACPRGKFANITGLENCHDCDRGKYSEPEQTECFDCSIGKYHGDNRYITDDDDCTVCEAGKYADETGMSECTPCPDNKTSAAESTMLENCTCEKGFTSALNNECHACEAGKYKNTTGPDACTDCGIGKYNPHENATSEASCMGCRNRTFADTEGNAECSPCPKNASQGDNATYCVCDAGFKKENEADLSCSACPAGKFSDSTDSAECEDCDMGYFSEQNGSTTCTKCIQGKYNIETGQSYCKDCFANAFQPEGSLVCVCDAGFKKNDANEEKCDICPAGKYSSSNATSCTDCDAGTISSEGASACTGCTAGKFAKDASQCMTCSAGEFSGVNASECDICEAGKFSSEGASACTGCSAGKFAENPSTANQCMTCPAGKSSGVNASVCEICRAGSYSSIQSPNCTVCEAGKFAESDETKDNCTRCEAGKFSEANASVCQICPAGFYSSSEASICTQCEAGKFAESNETKYNCTICAAGKFSEANATVCQICAAGFYSDSNASICTQCEAGKFAEFNETKYNCTTCEAGKYSSTNATICQDCKPGSFSNRGDANCTTCTYGKYASEVGRRHNCTACPENSGSSEDYSECWCNSGYFSNSSDTEECTECVAGKYKNVLSDDECKECDAGKASNLIAQTNESTCITCALGKFASYPGSTQCDSCQNNSKYFEQYFNLTDCQCLPGFTGPNGVKCTACPKGKYKDSYGESECQNCPSGTASNIYAANNSELCIECTAGQYSKAGASTCSTCEAGKYQEEPKQQSCVNCAKGKILPNTGSSSRYDCTACRRNEFSDIEGADKCKKCPNGTKSDDTSTDITDCICKKGYEATEGGTECRQCVMGSYKNSEGIGLCNSCEKGKRGSEYRPRISESHCVSCAKGEYSVEDGSTDCSKCPEGKTTHGMDATKYADCLCKTGHSPKFTPYFDSLPCKSTSVRSDARCDVEFTGLNPGNYTLLLQVYQTDFSSIEEYLSVSWRTNHETKQFTMLDEDGQGHDGGVDGDCKMPIRKPILLELEALDGYIKVEINASQEVNNAGCRNDDLVGDNVLFVNVSILSNKTRHKECETCEVGKFKNDVSDKDCTECEPGKFSTNFLQCTECDAGKYQNVSGSSSCMNCPQHSSSEAGSNQSTDCECNKGYTGPDGGPCTACVAGKYKGETGSSVCSDCAAGKASGKVGADDEVHCKECAGTNAHSKEGATNCENCVDNSYFDAESQECVCRKGYFGNANATSNAKCEACATGKYKAEPGNRIECSQCEISKYNPQTAQTSVNACIDCDPNAQTMHKGATNIDECACNPGYKNTNIGCAECSEGKYTTSSGQLRCSSCMPGKFGNGTDRTGVEHCLICEAGKYQDQEGTVACKTCRQNSNSAPAAKSPEECLCNAGFFEPEDEYECRECPSGTYKEDLGNEECPGNCQENEASKLPRTHSSDCVCEIGFHKHRVEICTACPPGKAKGVIGNDECGDCAAGKYTDVSGETICTLCPSSTFQSDTGKSFCEQCARQRPGEGWTSCDECEAGQFLKTETNECTACPKGTYKEEGGLEQACTPCPAGTYNNITGATSSSQCTFCPANSNSSEGSQSEEACQCVHPFKKFNGKCYACDLHDSGCQCNPGRGRIFLDDNNAVPTCEICEIGKYSTGGVNEACQSCGSTRDTEQEGSASDESCLCKPGFQDNDDGEECTPCQKGYYKPSLKNELCTSCSTGETTTDIESDSQSDCECKAGYTGPDGGPCNKCEKGEFKPEIGSAICSLCPTGKYGNTKGLTSLFNCTDCPISKRSDEGSTSINDCKCKDGFPDDGQGGCLQCGLGEEYDESLGGCTFCSKGKYKDDAQVALCIPCRVNTYNDITGATTIDSCQACMDHSTSPEETTEQSSCICDAGYEYASVGNTAECRPCVEGKHKPNSGNLESCEPCTQGKVSSTEASTECIDCYATDQYPNSNGQNCESCTGNRLAVANSYTADDCQCKQGFELNGAECTSCAAGKFKDEISDTVTCEECADGKVSEAGASSCYSCEGNSQPKPDKTGCDGCPAGQVMSDGENKDCALCEAGKFAKQGAMSCSTCSAGKSSPQGAESCTDCDAGKFSKEDTSSCTDCPANEDTLSPGASVCFCAPGHTRDGTECKKCVAGTWKAEVSDASCQECTNSTHSEPGATSSTDCVERKLNTQTIHLNKGETWISFNLQKLAADGSVDVHNPDQVIDVFTSDKTSTPWAFGDSIMDQEKSIYYHTTPTPGWQERPWSLKDIDAKRMFKVHRQNEGTLTYQGGPVALPLTLSLKRGDNWIPNPYPVPVSIKDHMPIREGNLPYIYGDRMTSQGATMMFYTSDTHVIDWLGELSNANFEPGAGYILHLHEGGQYTFPEMKENHGQGRRLLSHYESTPDPDWEQSTPPEWKAYATDDWLECKVDGYYVPWTEIDAQVMIDANVQNGGVLAAFRGDKMCGVSGERKIVPGESPPAAFRYFEKSGEPFFRVRCCELQGTEGLTISFKFSLDKSGDKIHDLTFPDLGGASSRRDGKLLAEENKRTKIGTFDDLPLLTTTTRRVRPAPSAFVHEVTAVETHDGNGALLVFMIYLFFFTAATCMCFVCFFMSRHRKLYEESLAYYMPVAHGPVKAPHAFFKGLRQN